MLALYLWSFECIFRPFSSSPSLGDEESLRPRLDRTTLCSRHKPKFKFLERDKTVLSAKNLPAYKAQLKLSSACIYLEQSEIYRFCDYILLNFGFTLLFLASMRIG